MTPSLRCVVYCALFLLPSPASAQAPDPVQAAGAELAQDGPRTRAAAQRLKDFILGPPGFVQQGVPVESLAPMIQEAARAWILQRPMPAAVILETLDKSGDPGRLGAALGRWKGTMGTDNTAEWIAGFLNDASEQGTSLLLAQRTSAGDIQKRLEARRKENAAVAAGGGASRDATAVINAQPRTVSPTAPAPPIPAVPAEEPAWKKTLKELYEKWWPGG